MGLGHQKTVIFTDRWEDGHFHFLKVFGGCLRKSSFSDLPSELWDFPSTDALSGIQSPSKVPWPVWGPWLLSPMRCVCLSFPSCYGPETTACFPPPPPELASGTPVSLEGLSPEPSVTGVPLPWLRQVEPAWHALGPDASSSSFRSTGSSNNSHLLRFLGNPTGAM